MLVQLLCTRHSPHRMESKQLIRIITYHRACGLDALAHNHKPNSEDNAQAKHSAHHLHFCRACCRFCCCCCCCKASTYRLGGGALTAVFCTSGSLKKLPAALSSASLFFLATSPLNSLPLHTYGSPNPSLQTQLNTDCQPPATGVDLKSMPSGKRLCCKRLSKRDMHVNRNFCTQLQLSTRQLQKPGLNAAGERKRKPLCFSTRPLNSRRPLPPVRHHTPLQANIH